MNREASEEMRARWPSGVRNAIHPPGGGVRSGKVEGKREGVGVGVGASARSSSSGDSSRKGAEVDSWGGVEGGLREGGSNGLGGGEEGVSVPSHPMRANVKITAQTKVYIAFFIGGAKTSFIEKDS
jgi:hypothetical protein